MSDPTRPEPSTQAGRDLLAGLSSALTEPPVSRLIELIQNVEAEARPTVDLRSIVEEVRDRLAARGQPQHPEWSVLILAALDHAAAASAPKEDSNG